MATVKFVAFEHHKKSDGKINFKLCVYHKTKRVYISTNYTVVESQLKKDYTIKDKDIKAQMLADELIYLKKISELGWELDSMTAKELGEYLLKPSQTIVTKVDFVKFCREHIASLKAKDKVATAGNLQTVVNNLIDFTGFDIIYTSTITSKMLRQYEAYLSSPYVQVRKNHIGKDVSFKRQPMSEGSIFGHMNHFRMLFNAARNKYNDLDTGNIIIHNYPFGVYKPKRPKESNARSVSISLVCRIRDFGAKKGSSIELAKDIFMLSFYMLGMNAKDIYELKEVSGSRLDYNRSKTRDKRQDSAFISVKIIPEARILLDKYVGVIRGGYSTPHNFRYAVWYGMSKLSLSLGVPKFTFYSARHTVATEARNTLGFSVADIGEALNHTRAESRITDTYIKKDWKKIDEIQAKVVALLRA